MKRFFLITILLLLITFVFADIIIGTGTSTGRYPLNDYYVYSKSQCIYLASEINCSSGTISHLQWYRSDTGADPNAIGTTEIWLTETAATTLSTWQPEGTLVATISNIDLGSGGAWYDVDITDYAYGGGNLMVSVRTQNAPYTSPHSYWYYTATTAYRSLLGNSDTVNPPSVSTSYSRPNIKLVGINTTVYPEPTNHVTGFAAGTVNYTSVQLNWTGSTGTQLPGNYLIQAIKVGSGSYAAVADATPVANDAVWTDNNAAINVAHVVGANTYTFTGLTANTAYEFKIWPYTNSLTNINFKTDGIIPTVNATTLNPLVTTFPWTIDFGTTSTFPPANWTKLDGLYGTTPVSTNSGWFSDDFCNVVTSPQNMSGALNIWSTGTKYWLVTPPIAIPATGYELKFDLGLTTYSGVNVAPTAGAQADDKFMVLIADNPGMTGATVLREWNNTGSPYVYDTISPFGENLILDLDAFTGTRYIAFYGESTIAGGDNNVFVDNVTIRETPLAAIFTLNPDVTSWDFGMAAVDHAKTKVFTISNTGGAPLTLTSVNATGTYYSISVPPAIMTIPAGSSTTFTVQYLPTAVGGPFAGTLDIVFSRETRSVSLSGSAYAPATLPITEGFEAGFGTWVIQNGTQLNQWTVGTATFNTGTQSAYISNDAGVSNAYDPATTSIVHFYKDIVFPTGADRYNLSFNWKGYGESSYYDYLQVFLVDTSVDPVAGTRLTSGQIGTNYNLQNTWQSAAIQIPNTIGGTVKRLVFSWWNDSSGGSQPPIAVDDIALNAIFPSPPDAVTLTSPADGATALPKAGFDLTWTPATTGGTVNYYAVYMSQDEANIYSDIYFETTATSLNPTSYAGGPGSAITFNYEDRYYWTVEAVNDLGSAVVEPAHSFVIESDPTVTLPYTQDFGTTLTWPTGWTQTNTGGVTDRWAVTDSNNAGSVSNEMTLTWISGTFISRLISPPINTNGIANIAVNFQQTYDGYAAGVNAKIQYSNDLTTWYDSSWSLIGGSTTVGPNLGTALITGISAPVTYVAWVLDGNHFNVDHWYVDDVSIQVPPDHDVAALSYDVTTEVVPENTSVTPMATVGNNGINTETFTVTCTIGTYSNTQTVTGLAMGATQQVSFAPLIPALWTGNTVTITTNLGTDTVAANNTVTGALICLDLNIPGLANNANTDAFVSFNLADPTTVNILPNAYSGTYFIAGADWMNGAWMGVEYDDGTLATDNYYNINPLTGVYLPSLGEPGVAIMGNAWDDTHSIMYGVGAGNLYTMNPTTGVATLLGTMWYNNSGTNVNFADINGLMIDIAYDNLNNVLYGIDLGNDCLWTINTSTYEVTFIGYLGIDLNYAQDAAFDQTSGMLFLAGYAGGGALYWIDTTSGAAYKVNNFPSSQEFTAFAIPYGTFATGPIATMTGSGTVSWDAVPGAVSYNVYSSDDPYGTFTLEDNVIGTSYTNTTASYKFYKIAAVGGRQVSNRQPIRMAPMMKKAPNAKNFKPLFTNVAR